MSYIDITWARQGTGAQQYYFDDFTLFGNTSSTAIPEPNTLLLLSVAGAGLFTIRRRLQVAVSALPGAVSARPIRAG